MSHYHLLVFIFLSSLFLGTTDEALGKPTTKALFKEARLLVGKKKVKEAQAVYRQILKANPNDPEAEAGLAWTLFSQGETDEALQLVKKAIKTNDKIPMAHNVLGAIYMSKGMTEEGKEEFRTVLRLDPKRRCGGCMDLRGYLGVESKKKP